MSNFNQEKKRKSQCEPGHKDEFPVITRENSPAYNNKVVYMSGTLLKDRAIVDHEMGVNCTPNQDPNILSITRSVQVFQWVETVTEMEEKIAENLTRTNTVYSYKAEWSKSHVDSNNFDNRKYRVNIKPSIRDSKFQPQRLSLDEVSVNTAYGCQLIEAHGTRLSVRNLICQLPPDNKGQWKFMNDNTIQRRFVDSADTIGDLMVTYDVRTFAGGEVTIPGLMEHG